MRKPLFLGVSILAVIFAACSMPLNPPAAAKAGEGLPPAPQKIAAQSASETSVALTWDAVSGAVRYFVYRSAHEDTEYARVAAADGNGYTDENLEPDSDYYYKISTAKDNVGEGPQSQAVFASTKKLPPPENITTRVVTTARIDVEWDAVGGAASYKIYRLRDGQYKMLSETTECSYTDENNVSANNTYYYKISTVSEIGEGAQSEAYSAATLLPETPQNIIAAVHSTDSIAVSWQNVPGATGYRVYRSASADGSYSPLAPDTVERVFIDTGLTAETDYFYKVSAFNGIGEGALSAVHAAASIRRPQPPAGISVTGGTVAGSLNVSWGAVSGATGYRVYRAGTADGVYGFIAETADGLTAYIDTGLVVGTTYFYKVSAVSAAGESEKSGYASAVTPSIPAPGNFTATVESAASIRLSWSAVSGATAYKLYRALTSDGEYSLIATVTGSSYLHTGLSKGSTYYYKISSVSGTVEGSLSASVGATIAVPAAPAGISVTGGTVAGSLNVSWGAVSGATGYRVYRAGTADGAYVFIAETADELTAYIDTGLVVGTTYFYKVSVVSVAGEGEKSDYASAVAPSIPAPGNFTATVESAASIRLSWSAVSGATAYKLYRALTSDGEYSLIATVTGSSYLHTGLSKGSTYYYKISSVSGEVEGSLSASVGATIAVPAVPAGLTVEPVSSTSLKVSWDPVPGAMLYSIYRNDYNDDVYASNIITSTTNTEYVDTGLEPFRRYYYKVSAVNDIGTGNLSATAVSAYTQPIPLTNGTWYDNTSYLSYYYYSFPVTGGNYNIQWAYTSHAGEANTEVKVSAYWNSKNSMTDLTVTYFSDATNGFASPRTIDAPDSGYIILKIYRNSSSYCNYSIRFYK